MPVNAAPASSDSTRERARPRRTATPYARSGSTARRMAPGRKRKAIAPGSRSNSAWRCSSSSSARPASMPVVNAVTASSGASRVPTRRMLAACSAAAAGEGWAPAEQEHRGRRARRSADHEQRPVADEAEQGHADEERHQGAVLLAREQPGVRRRVDGELRAGLGAQRDPEERAARAADRRADGDHLDAGRGRVEQERRRVERGAGGGEDAAVVPVGQHAARAGARQRERRLDGDDDADGRRACADVVGGPQRQQEVQDLDGPRSERRRVAQSSDGGPGCQPQAGRGYRAQWWWCACTTAWPRPRAISQRLTG